MEAANIVMEVPLVVPPPPPPTYNITLNLTSILSFLPSRLLSRFWRRSWDDFVEAAALGDPFENTAHWATEAVRTMDTNAGPIAPMPTPKLAGSQIPSPHSNHGPWGFFVSSYMLAIVLMAIVLHRIQNIVIPSRIPPNRGLRPGVSIGWRRRFAFFGRISSALFPLDLESTSTRLSVHLPSLYLVFRMLAIWFVLVLQTSNMWPENTGIGWVEQLGGFVRKAEMEEVCWKTFVAVSACFAVEGFMNALEGIEAGFPIGRNLNPNTSPFTIFGYAFLLHLYSSPFAHGQNTGDTPSRPDKHAVMTITIPLIQFAIFHALSVSKKLSTHRLLPTTLTSFLSLTHFYCAIWFFCFVPFEPTPEELKVPHARLLTSYPILNYVPNIFETGLIATILLTVILNVIVQMVVRGRVDRLFSGLGGNTIFENADDDPIPRSAFFNFFRNLNYDEDFGVLLLKVATASLEATGLRGWNNEVAPVTAPVVVHSRDMRTSMARLQQDAPSVEYGSVRIGRFGAGGVTPGSRTVMSRQANGLRSIAGSSSGGQSTQTQAAVPQRRVQTMRGLRNEVRSVDLGLRLDGQPSGEANRAGGWWNYFRELMRFGEAAWAAVKGLVVMSWTCIKAFVRGRRHWRSRHMDKEVVNRRRSRRPSLSASASASVQGAWVANEEDSVVGDNNPEWETVDEERVVYQRFLEGEEITDDEDEHNEFVPPDSGEGSDVEVDSISPTTTDLSNDAGGEWEDEEGGGELELEGGGGGVEREAFALFTELLHAARSAPGDLSYLMSRSLNNTPMTRRRWAHHRSMAPPTAAQEDDNSASSDTRLFVRGASASTGQLGSAPPQELSGGEAMVDPSARALCVICTVEMRDIICWPCRCLAMCDGCRDSMASQSAPTRHRCPCCRQLTEGYSRIYVP